MELDAEVDLPADGLADRGEARDEVVDAGGLTHQVVLFLEQEDLQRRVALVADRTAGRLDDLIGGTHLEHDLHRANLAPCAPPEQLPNRNLEMLSLEIPERLVERTDRAGDRHAAEAERSVQREPVMLEVEGIAATEIGLERPHDLGDRRRPAEVGRLAHPGRAVRGGDAHVAGAACGNGLHGFDAHRHHGSLRLRLSRREGRRTPARSEPSELR